MLFCKGSRYTDKYCLTRFTNVAINLAMHIDTSCNPNTTEHQRMVVHSHIQCDLWFLSRGTETWPYLGKMFRLLKGVLARTKFPPDLLPYLPGQDATAQTHNSRSHDLSTQTNCELESFETDFAVGSFAASDLAFDSLFEDWVLQLPNLA